MVTVTSTSPGMPHVETVDYRLTHRRPFTHDPVATEREHLDDMLDLAARVLRDDVAVDSVGVVGLCETIEALDLDLAKDRAALRAASQQLAALQGQSALLFDALRATRLELEAARRDLALAERLRLAALQDANQQRELAARLSRQYAALTTPPEIHVAPLRLPPAYEADVEVVDEPTGVCGPDTVQMLVVGGEA